MLLVVLVGVAVAVVLLGDVAGAENPAESAPSEDREVMLRVLSVQYQKEHQVICHFISMAVFGHSMQSKL